MLHVAPDSETTPFLRLALLGVVIVALSSRCIPQEDREGSSPMPEVQETLPTLPGPGKKLLGTAQKAFKTANYQQAVAVTSKMIKMAPANVDLSRVYELRGRSYSQMTQYDKAAADFNWILERHPGYRRAYVLLGEAAIHAAQYHDAIRHYRSALKLGKESSTLLNLGRSYVQVGKSDSARWAFEQALEIDPDAPAAHNEMAKLLKRSGERSQALKHARRAAKVDPDNMEYQYRLGALLHLTGKSQTAIAHLTRVVENDPWHYGAHYTLGQALLKTGRNEEAQRHLTRVERLQHLISEIQSVERSTRAHPDSAAVWADLGDLRRKAQMYQEAAEAYNRALSLEPDNQDYRSALTEIQEHLSPSNP